VRTTGHIVRKDVRRLAIPVAVWLAFQAGALAWFAQAPGFLAHDVATWVYGYGLWAELILIGQVLFSFVLVGVLMLEDPTRGSDVFWRTRPVSGARLLAAKSVAAVLLFVVAPALVLLPIWLSLGFTLGQAGRAGVTLMQGQLGVVLLGLAAGSAASSLAQHVGVVIVLFGLHTASSAAGAWLGGQRFEATSGSDLGSNLLTFAGWVLLAGFASVQFTQRRRAWSGVLLALTLPLFLLQERGWTPRADGTLPFAFDRERGNPVPAQPATVQFERIRGPAGVEIPAFGPRATGGPSLDLGLQMAETGQVIAVPVGAVGELSGPGRDPVPVTWLLQPSIPADCVRAIAGGQAGPSAARWSVELRRRGETRTTLPPAQVTMGGRAFVHHYRGRIMGTMPVREGSTLTNGSNTLRIVAVQPAVRGDASSRIVLEERESTVGGIDGHTHRNRYSFGSRTSKLDSFVLQVGRALYVLEVQELGGVALASVAVGGRRLILPNLPWPDIQQATLIKVRFERTGRFAQDVSAAGIEITGGPQS